MKVELIFAVFAALVSQINGLQVTVFYESLCPDSIRFIETQLLPNYDALKDNITLDFVPFGKATYTTDPWTVTCQHGPRECKGNMMQACALNEYQENETQVQFVGCVMGDDTPDTAGEKCAKQLNLSYEEVQKCTDSDLGEKLVAELGDRTLNFVPKIKFVPTIVYDGVYDQDDQDQSLKDFKSVCCSKIQGIKPSACSDK